MNKMLKGDIIDIESKEKYNVSFFDDDSIETVRTKIAISSESHHDRLFILVGLKLPGDYYTKDPRRWEKLFERLSYNGKPIEKEIFVEYQSLYRYPNTSVPFKNYDKAEWMEKPEELRPFFESTEFTEYRILGVDEMNSFVLQFDDTAKLTKNISSTRLPIPDNSKLFSSLYNPEEFSDFRILKRSEDSENLVLYPLFRSVTPTTVSDEMIKLLNKNSKLLENLLKLKVPEPTNITIIRTRFYIPWVDTDFGSAIRTRFEQFFYGLTVSKDVPYIGFFTSKDQASRHKFYTETSKKEPYLNMDIWKTWWSIKPSRNIPTILLFNGKSKHHFNRISITATDMVISTYRPEGNTETIEQLQRQIIDWIPSFDAILPYIVETDLDISRWELQDMSYVVNYSEKIDGYDLLRFNCLSNIFDIFDKTKSQFNILRTDHSSHGFSAIELKILHSLKEERGNIDPKKISEELSISEETVKNLIEQVRNKLNDDEGLAERAFRGYPVLKFGPNFSIVSAVSNFEKSLHYSNILRYILSDSNSDELDKICPKRVEQVSAESTIITSTVEEDAAVEEEFSDMFGWIQEDEEVEDDVTVVEEPTKISTGQYQTTTYSYFLEKLRKFDPETFDIKDSKYPKKCNKNQQPVILTPSEIRKLPSSYNIESIEDSKKLNLDEPSGTAICPEYWCMKDQIPLQESQLIKEDFIRCPVCRGKLQTNSTDNPKEFPLIKRDTGFIYPGYTKHKSINNKKFMPCCYKTSRSKSNSSKEDKDKYYILSDDKSLNEERIAFLNKKLIESLHLNENYELFKNTTRLMSPNKGFFRVGLGNISNILHKFLGKDKVSLPRNSVKNVLKCSFFHTWNKVGTDHLVEINNNLKKLTEFENDDLLREELSKLISGFDEAFHKDELSSLQNLEYSAISLQCDVFRIHTDTNKLGCLFYSPIVRPRSCAIIILQDNDEIDILAYTERVARGFKFESNIYKEPFRKETYEEVEKLRNASCKTNLPSYSEALDITGQLLKETESDDFQTILDPFGRGQAFFVKSKFIIPFQSTPLPEMSQSKINGYKDILTEELPEYSEMKKYLDIARKTNPGYNFKEDLYNNSQKVEILLECGLRIPIKPIDSESKEPKEVIETVREIGETELVFGKESEELRTNQINISYAAEIYEFLIFQLSHDIQTDDYKDIVIALSKIPPILTEVKPLLEKWFNEMLQFNEIGEPKKFLSKIRKPCNDTCDGELCGWDGKVCKVQINKTLNKEKLFYRLLTTLIDNSKIRSMILDGRTTPFFSTILYLELPHELILTDNELP